jgi:hypothetical protein
MGKLIVFFLFKKIKMAIGGQKKVMLTPESILSLITSYDIFRFYMPIKSWSLNAVTYSPFRNEKNPSFIISNRNNELFFIDFTDTSKKGNCFHFVKELFHLANIDEVLKLIDKDFSLGILSGSTPNYERIVSEYKQPEETIKKYSLIQVKTRKFTHEELAYWNEYHQDISDLKDNNIYSVDKVYLNKQLFTLKDTELRFGYFYDNHWKIYKPHAEKKYKWVPNNVPITAMDGLENIKDSEFAFINKSKKDYMVIKKLLPNTCAVQNEGMACFSEENIDYLKANSKKQILSFDADVTGVKNSQQITELFGFDYCNVPKQYLHQGVKDWADLAKDFGMNTVENYLKRKQLI